MTKEEALIKLKEGFVITHFLFTPDEWIKQEGNFIVYEDGNRVFFQQFWLTRNYPAWDSGYSVV